MSKILYTAKNKFGKVIVNFIDVNSNEKAIEILKQEGYSDITIKNDAFNTPVQRKDLDGLSSRQLKIIAELELKSLKGVNLKMILIGHLKTNLPYYLVGFVIAVFGFIQNRNMTLIFGLLILIILPIISVWRYRHSKRYHNILVSYTYGNWNTALRLIQKQRRFKKLPEIDHDLDFREASILAKKDKLKQALELSSKWKGKFNDKAAGYFESRLSGVYYSAGDYEKCLNLLNESYLKSDKNPLYSLDIALAEARYGDTKRATKLIEDVDMSTLPEVARPYPDWILGMVAKRNNSPDSINLLHSALTKLLNINGTPLTLIMIAICTGEYAVVLHRNKEKDNAIKLLKGVWEILVAHGYKSLVADVKKILGIC